MRSGVAREDTHVTTPTQFVQAGGICFAYRGSGQDTGVALGLHAAFLRRNSSLFKMENHRRRRDKTRGALDDDHIA